MLVQPGDVQCEVSPEGRTIAPTANSINYSSDPSEFLDLSGYLLMWVWTPDDIQRPHFGISENNLISGVKFGVRPGLLSDRVCSRFHNHRKRRV